MGGGRPEHLCGQVRGVRRHARHARLPRRAEETEHAGLLLKEAERVFDRRVRDYYSQEEIRTGKVLSFKRDGEPVDIGLMRLITATLDHNTEMSAEDIIPYLADLCTQAERKAL